MSIAKMRAVFESKKGLIVITCIILSIIFIGMIIPFQSANYYDSTGQVTSMLKYRLLTSHYFLLGIFILAGYAIVLILLIVKKVRIAEILLFTLGILVAFMLLFMVVEYMKNKYALGKVYVGAGLFIFPLGAILAIITGLVSLDICLKRQAISI